MVPALGEILWSHGPSWSYDVLRPAWCALKLLELQALAHQIQFQQYCAMAKTVLDTFNQIHVESSEETCEAAPTKHEE